MSDTEKRLEETRYFFKRMLETYQTPFEFECNLQAFRIFGRSVTFVMQEEYSKIPAFISWYQGKREEMQSDEMLNFFQEARKKTIHEKPLGVGTAAHIKEIYLQSVPKGWGFTITGKGEPVWVTPTGERIHASEYDRQVERVYLFDNPPRSFLGAQLKDFSAVTLCRLYLAYLSVLVAETAKFT
jgi:hypothetical protein